MSERDDQSDRSSVSPLIGRDRIRGAARVIPEDADAAKVSAEQIAAVANDVEVFRRANKIDRKAIAMAIGYTESVVSEFLTGKYAGNSGQVAIDLEHWLIEEESRRKRPQTTTFTWSNVALLIKSTASYAIDYRTIALIYGPDTTGIGKTTALQAVHQTIGPRRSALITIDKVDANPSGLLRKICGGLHVDDKGSNHQRFGRIVKYLTGRSHILLIDQIQNLRGSKEDKPFYILADIYDATKAAQLWCGTADLVAYLNRQRVKSSDESLAQIRRRLFPCVDLMGALRGSDGGGDLLVTLDQVREMFSRSKLRIVSEATRFLCQLINTPDSGSIGLAVQLVDYAIVLAELSGRTAIDVPLLRQAMRQGFMPERAELMLQQVEQESARLAKVG